MVWLDRLNVCMNVAYSYVAHTQELIINAIKGGHFEKLNSCSVSSLVIGAERFETHH